MKSLQYNATLEMRGNSISLDMASLLLLAKTQLLKYEKTFGGVDFVTPKENTWSIYIECVQRYQVQASHTHSYVEELGPP